MTAKKTFARLNKAKATPTSRRAQERAGFLPVLTAVIATAAATTATAMATTTTTTTMNTTTPTATIATTTIHNL